MSSSTPPRTPLTRSMRNAASSTPNSRAVAMFGKKNNATPSRRVSAVGTRKISSVSTPPRKHGATAAPVAASGTPRKATGTPISKSSSSNAASSTAIINGGGDEGIQVAIRMRPLNTNESAHRSVWKVIPKYNSVAQTTPEGQPLPERVTGRTFFTFDKTFAEQSTTKDVYNHAVKDIVSSFVTGLNGTIFAYGQTSSGKTYTMQGSGSIQDGAMGSGGIVHMAAQDIFDHIRSTPDRLFLVRASFLEIYNEEVRDLLSADNKTLQIREDPRRGVFVQSVEEVVTDFSSLLEILFRGEKSRAFAATAMNERSSRSHTIFRVTIESRQKSRDENGENTDPNVLDEDDSADGAVLISTLNLVDLAGSESVRHTGATGERQKEGGMINQSLLTLSRVIVALGTANQQHVNFRDSKLTRILQPSLSGNARMAVICCATPSELYLEETRSTLMFASRAKLVKTNAQVNEVLDDRSLIKRLQRELAEAKRHVGSSTAAPEHVKELEHKAATAGTAAREAEEKLRRLHASLLNSGVLFGGSEGPQQTQSSQPLRKRRRLSDGNIVFPISKTPEKEHPNIKSPTTLPRAANIGKVVRSKCVSPASQISLLRDALQAKSSFMKSLHSQLSNAARSLQSKESELIAVSCTNDILRSERDNAREHLSKLESDLMSHTEQLTDKESQIEEILATLEKELAHSKELEQVLDALQAEKAAVQNELDSEREGRKQETQQLQSELKSANSRNIRLEESLVAKKQECTKFSNENHGLQRQIECTENDVEQFKLQIEALKSERDCLREENEQTKAESAEFTKQIESLSATVCNLRKEKEAAIAELERAVADLEEVSQDFQSKTNECSELEAALVSLRKDLGAVKQESQEKSQRLEETVAQMNEERTTSEKLLEEQKQAMEKLRTENESMKSAIQMLEDQIKESTTELNERTEELSFIRNELETVELKFAELTEVHDRTHQSWESSKNFLEESQQQINLLESRLSSSASMIDDLRAECTATKRQLAEETETATLTQTRFVELEARLAEYVENISSLENARALLSDERDDLLTSVESLRQSNEELCNQMAVFQTKIESSEASLSESNDRAAALSEERNELASQLQDKNEQLSSIEKRFSVMSGERDSLLSENQSLLESKQVLCNQITELENSLKSMETQCQNNTAEMKILLDERDSLAVKVTESSERIQLVEEELASTTEERNALLLKLNSLEQLDSELGNQVLELQNAGKAIHMELTEYQNMVAALTSERHSMTQELQQKNNALEEAECKLTKLSDDNAILTSDHASVQEANAELERQVVDIQKIVEDIEAQLQAYRETIAKLTEESESLLSQSQNNSDLLATSENEVRILSEKCDSLTAMKAELEREVIATRTELEECVNNMQALEEERQTLANEMRENSQQLASLQADISILTTERNNISNENNRLKETNDDLHNQVSDLHSKSEFMVAELEHSKEKIRVLTEKAGSYESDSQNSTSELLQILEEKENLVKQNVSLQEQNHDLSKRILELHANAERLESELEHRLQNLRDSKEMETRELRDEVKQVSEHHNAANIELTSAREELAEKHALVESMKNNETLLSSRIAELEHEIDGMRIENFELSNRLNESEKVLQSKNDEIKNLDETLQHLQQEINTLNEQVKHFEDELVSKERMLSNCMTALEEEKTKAEKIKIDDIQKIENLEKQLKGLQSESDLHNIETSHILQAEIDNLKVLLASSNSLVDESRNAASSLQKELDAREGDIRLLRQLVDDKNAELEHLKNQSNYNRNADESRMELASKLEQAKYENAKLQRDLDCAVRDRVQAEEELRRRMGDEQRALIKEAEANMVELRSRIRMLEESLASAEAEAYAARESSEDFRDQHQQSVERSIQLESKLSSLENECSRLRKSVSRAEQQRETEVSTLTTDVKKLKAEKYALEARLRTFEQALEQENRQNRKLSVALDAYAGIDIQELKEDNETLRAKVSTLEMEINTLLRANESLQSEHKTLKDNLSFLEHQISSKDERIKKLKSLTLTKEQTAALKRMKEERQIYKNKYENAKKEMATLKSIQGIPKASSNTTSSDELTELRFDNEALEKKIRKFAAHSQRLEEEKAKVVQALRSSSVLGQVDAHDITAAVTDLCDRLASLEEECDSLSKSDSRVSSLLVEIETLREQNTRLTAEMAALQKKAQMLDKSVGDLKARTSKLHEERESWRQSAVQAQEAQAKLESSGNEKGRQLRYLEQENLQLMFDLKAMKKQVQSLTDEVNMLKKSDDDDAFDFNHLSSQNKMDSAHARAQTSSTKRKTPSSPSDKENTGNILLSANKQRRRDISNNSSRKIRSVGLDKALSEANEENTQECTQS